MRKADLLAAAMLCTVSWSAPASAEAVRVRELVSIVGLHLQPNEVIDSFHIDTWSVTPLVVCRIPYSWRIKAGKYSSPEGELSGEGDTFGSLLTAEELSKVSFLADVWEGKSENDGSGLPLFAGKVTVTWPSKASGNDIGERKITLKPSNIRHRPAAACPPPSKPDE